ncbi:hypothetical protein FE257_010026 [Aspergillus nanangensis]|uniref:Enoyl reductase (ER) domain-containing protein n=1 Tax=Aspergillus nanangensis TaxID=2582783 RepID=A0AAD4CWL5_ASPNN|nr:hypothetical protein FE257_010026 [Aspergillus nanangensis]
MAIPQTQIAAALPPTGASPDAKLLIRSDYPVPNPAEDEVLIKFEYSGVCHSDVHSVRGETPMLTDVAGHEGVGKVVKEYIVSPAVHVTKIPPQLAPDTAAPLLCAGIAMYSSIMKTKTRPGDWIVLPGAGGGLGHMGVQIAVKKGLKVIAIDSGEKKKQLCLSLGATSFFDYKVQDVEKEVLALTSGLGAHAVICTANSEPAYTQSMRMLRRLGVLVCVGIPSVPFKLPATPFDMIVKGLTIVGNSAGTAKEMDELMEMAVAGEVKAHIECFSFSEIENVLQRLGRSEIDGRAVVKIPE